jgi:hypothetical protein
MVTVGFIQKHRENIFLKITFICGVRSTGTAGGIHNTEQVALAMMLWSCTRDVMGSNFGRDTGSPY